MRLPDIFQHIHDAWSAIDGRLRAEQFKVRRANLADHTHHPSSVAKSDEQLSRVGIMGDLPERLPHQATKHLSRPGAIETGSGKTLPCIISLAHSLRKQEKEDKKSKFDDDIDGKPINSESEDSRPPALVADYDDEEDIDGKPISADSDIDGRPVKGPPAPAAPPQARPRFQEESGAAPPSAPAAKPRFVATKWESVDPSQVAAQGSRAPSARTSHDGSARLAVTISKWDFDQEAAARGNDSLYDDLAQSTAEGAHPSNE